MWPTPRDRDISSCHLCRLHVSMRGQMYNYRPGARVTTLCTYALTHSLTHAHARKPNTPNTHPTHTQTRTHTLSLPLSLALVKKDTRTHAHTHTRTHACTHTHAEEWDCPLKNLLNLSEWSLTFCNQVN